MNEYSGSCPVAASCRNWSVLKKLLRKLSISRGAWMIPVSEMWLGGSQ